MPNAITDPGFETPDWTFVDLAFLIDSFSRSGSNCAWITNNKSGVGLDKGGAAEAVATFVGGATYHVAGWLYIWSASGEQAFRFEIRDGAGVPVYAEEIDWLSNGGDLGGVNFPTDQWSEWKLPDFKPSADFVGTVRLEFPRRSTNGSDQLFVDDVSIVDDAAKRREIKRATLDALRTISVANGFSTDVAEVTDERKAPRDIDAYPALQVVYAGEDKGPRELQRLTGGVRLTVIVYANGADAESVCDDLAADVEKKLTLADASGFFLGLPYVEDVRVERIDATEPTSAAHRERRAWLVRLLVEYRYDRGDP